MNVFHHFFAWYTAMEWRLQTRPCFWPCLNCIFSLFSVILCSLMQVLVIACFTCTCRSVFCRFCGSVSPLAFAMLWFCSWVLSQEWRETTSSWYCWYLSNRPDKRLPNSVDCTQHTKVFKHINEPNVAFSTAPNDYQNFLHLGVQSGVSVVGIL